MTTAIYFSATDTTKRITEAVASFGQDRFSSINLTLKESTCSFTAEDTVIVGVPVYAGRIPQIAAERLASVKADNTKCIALVVYGNRDYDDALLELCDILTDQGFNVVSAGAFIAEHCIFPEVANGRPDKEDMKDIKEFAIQSFAKTAPLDFSRVKGNRPYKQPGAIPMHPSVNEMLCNSCGTCAIQCPSRAINPANPRNTDTAKCITCCRCIHICPNGARGFSGTPYTLTSEKFTKSYSARRSPEWCI